MLQDNKADVGVVERLNGLSNEKKYRVDWSPIIFDPKSLVFAVTKNTNTGLLATIDTYIVAGKKDEGSNYNQIIQKWISDGTIEVVPGWVRSALITVIVSLIFFILISLYLRLLVKKKTRKIIQINEEMKKEIEDRKLAEEKILKAFQEKEVLLQEINHRVKNNMQVIISLLKLQAGRIQDERLLRTPSRLPNVFRLVWTWSGRPVRAARKDSRTSGHGSSGAAYLHYRILSYWFANYRIRVLAALFIRVKLSREAGDSMGQASQALCLSLKKGI